MYIWKNATAEIRKKMPKYIEGRISPADRNFFGKRKKNASWFLLPKKRREKDCCEKELLLMYIVLVAV